jgi:hypothetical protein
MNAITPPKKPPLSLGQVVSTPGALDALTGAQLCAEDARENTLAVREGLRILSSYQLAATGATVWIITAADRSVTTLLLSPEY